LSLVLAVFPFEASFYRRARVPVEYVGHPLVDSLGAAPSCAEARTGLALPAGAPVIGLLPGSRRGEVARLLPVMRDAAARLGARRPETRVLLAAAPTIDDALVRAHLGDVPVTIVRDAVHDVIRAADVVLATSGTVTLETALLGTPTVVCYRVSRPTALMIRSLIRVPWMSLPNLVLGRPVVPELFQEQATGERLAAEAHRLLEDAGAREAQRAAFAELGRTVGTPGVGARAARFVLRVALHAS
jgi:lipid-A-disaccharide synthase